MQGAYPTNLFFINVNRFLKTITHCSCFFLVLLFFATLNVSAEETVLLKVNGVGSSLFVFGNLKENTSCEVTSFGSLCLTYQLGAVFSQDAISSNGVFSCENVFEDVKVSKQTVVVKNMVVCKYIFREIDLNQLGLDQL